MLRVTISALAACALLGAAASASAQIQGNQAPSVGGGLMTAAPPPPPPPPKRKATVRCDRRHHTKACAAAVRLPSTPKPKS
jgi:hypothetical protein